MESTVCLRLLLLFMLQFPRIFSQFVLNKLHGDFEECPETGLKVDGETVHMEGLKTLNLRFRSNTSINN